MDKKRKKCVTFTYKRKRYYFYGRTMSEACEKMLRQKLFIKNDGEWINNSRITLEGYFCQWEQTRKGTVKQSTERTVFMNFKRIALCETGEGKTLGKTLLRFIDKTMILKAQKQLAAKVSSASVNNSVSLLKRICDDAVTDGILVQNPCVRIKALKRIEPQARDTSHRALTKKETRIFFRYAGKSHYYDLYLFLINSGMRCGEAAALYTDDVDGGFIRVRRSVTRTSSGYRIGDDAKTTAGIRDIPCTDALKAIIMRQRPALTESVEYCERSVPLFCSPKGKLIIPSNVDTDIRKICKIAGIEPFTSHAFRDTFATRAIESGMNPKTLQEILGHSSYGITMDLYAHVMPSTKVREMKRISITDIPH